MLITNHQTYNCVHVGQYKITYNAQLGRMTVGINGQTKCRAIEGEHEVRDFLNLMARARACRDSAMRERMLCEYAKWQINRKLCQTVVAGYPSH